jgi:hypothetical protein
VLCGFLWQHYERAYGLARQAAGRPELLAVMEEAFLDAKTVSHSVMPATDTTA